MFINKAIASLLPYFPKKFIWLFSKRYIAGTTIEDAIKIAQKLNNEKCKVSIDYLGEFVSNLAEAKRNKKEYLTIIDEVEKHKINGNYSLKPTMLGLLIDKEVCYRNTYEIVKKASLHNNFVRLDMEDSRCVDLEIELFRRIHKEFPSNIGLVIQSYLRRTHNDLINLSKENHTNIRICKGIYIEPEEISFKKHDEINAHFIADLEFIMKSKIYPAIATHDKKLIIKSKELIEKYCLQPDKYEFQMLYGVTPELRKTLLAEGHAMRVYLPFGKEWFGYSTRRLRENPKMISHIIKAIFVKK